MDVEEDMSLRFIAHFYALIVVQKRPFPPLKKLDMDDICSKVMDALA